ncbi:GGDEF domain-containing protein [Lysinibacillus antri]|uniref:GGDEF domain-containing protein n=1 Tax=Lysinibacillus antri TaxID=2498145 RepID=A0A3S0R5R4_9BACI|nr:GGDEF domain-containing protein [Lysinibacillus antri]RUL51648.1 GGDEF domain-containing protein [Lysinibacillus antri]
MFQSILSNLAIILLTHLIMSMLMHYRKRITSFTYHTLSIILVSCSIIAMFYLPIRFGDFWLDMRFIPLVFFAYFHGWKIAISSLIIAGFWRFLMGGDGMVPGILFGMIGPTLLALAFHSRANIESNYLEKLSLLIGCWLICDIPIIFAMPNGLEVFKDIAFIRSISFIITGIIWYIFIMQNRQLKYLYDELEKQAGEDPLTKLLNKRKFFDVVTDKVKSLKPNHYIAMVDIDHFKNINDTYGHLIGDKILIDVAHILKDYETKFIQVGRYGGEEFIIYIGNTTNEDAKKLIEQIHKKIKEHEFIIDEYQHIKITASIGLASLEDNSTLLHTVNKADINLYRAKQSGRNRFVCS